MKNRSITSIINSYHANTKSTLGEPNWLRKTGKPVVPTIDLSSAHEFLTSNNILQHYDNTLNSVRYGRDSSTISLQLEHYFSAVYDMPALVFDSGMSAISATLEIASNYSKKAVIIGELYRKSKEQLEYMSKSGILSSLEYFSIYEIEKLKKLNGVIIFFEAISNPHMHIVDLNKILDIIKKTDSIVIVDATLVGLDNAQDLLSNFDFVIHSATKYVNGFNDVVAGVTWSQQKYKSELWGARSRRGGLLDPWSCYLLFRSLRTYDLRSLAQRQNTEGIIKYLEQLWIKNKIKEIYYPGKYSNCHQKDIYERNFDHGGSLISFVPFVNYEHLFNRFSDLEFIKIAPSFGSVDSLIELPALMSHFGKTKKELDEISLEKNLVRFSVGCEATQTLINDLEKLF